MADPKKRIIVDGVDFGSLFQFPRILGSVTAAMQPPRLVVALLTVVALIAVGRLWDALATPAVHPDGLLAGAWTAEDRSRAQEPLAEALRACGAAVPEGALEAGAVLRLMEAGHLERRAPMEADRRTALDETYLEWRRRVEEVSPRGAFEATAHRIVASFNDAVRGAVLLEPRRIAGAARDVLVGLPVALWRHECTFALVYGLFFVLVAAVGGGALCRMAACEFAGFERLRVRDAFDFALGHWLKLALTILLPLLVAGGLALVLVAFGLLMAPWIDLLGGPLYGLALLLGFFIAFLLLGYAIGWPLLLPAVACENCDAAEAQQRAYAYALGRPLHLAGYGLMVLAGLAIGFLVVALVATTLLNVTASLVGAVTGSSALEAAGNVKIFHLTYSPEVAVHEGWHQRWAAGAVEFWEQVVVDLVAAYVVSCFFSSTTIVYLLMRRAADGQDVEEIWRPGLTPGTLVPLPRARVEAGEQE